MSRFDNVAQHWDSKSKRVSIAKHAVENITQRINTRGKKILDYGCGTGLLAYGLSEEAQEVVGMDSSRGMLEVFEQKNSELGFDNVRCEYHDANKDTLGQESFDLIVSSMTLHHIKDPQNFLRQCYAALKTSGQLCICDLDEEEGDFHGDNSGVEHFGFSHAFIQKIFVQSGFEVTFLENIYHITKEDREYPVFLIIGMKR
ncbi:MAG: class I SAM-dependent methyltransferase [Campylobacterota bacterium]